MLKRLGVEPTFSLLSFPGKWGMQCSGCVESKGSLANASIYIPGSQRQRPGLWSPQKIAFRPEWLWFIIQPINTVKTAGVLKKA